MNSEKQTRKSRLLAALGRMTVGTLAALLLLYNILLTAAFILSIGFGWGCA